MRIKRIPRALAHPSTPPPWSQNPRKRPRTRKQYPPAPAPIVTPSITSPPGRSRSLASAHAIDRGRACRPIPTERDRPRGRGSLLERVGTGFETWPPRRREHPPPAIEINPVIGRNLDSTYTLACTYDPVGGE